MDVRAGGGCGAGGGRAVVAAAAAGGPLRAAGRAWPAVPVPGGLRARDGGAHGGGRVQAHVAARLAQRAPAGARLLPLLEENLRADVLDLVRADAAANGVRPGAGARDPGDPGRRVRPVRGAPGGPAAGGRRARQPPRRQVGPAPPRPHAGLLPRQPQPAGPARRQVGGGASGAVARDGVDGRRRRGGGGGGRGGVVSGGGRGDHHARHVRAQLRLRPRRVPHAGPTHGLRLRSVPQGPRPRLPVLSDQEEPAVVEPGQRDQAGTRHAHRPAQRRGRRGPTRQQGQQRRLPRPAGSHDQCRRRQEEAGDPCGGHAGGVQDLLLRRKADHHQPAHLGHRAPRHAPGVAGPRTTGGRRRLRRRRAPAQGAPPQAQNGGHDFERDAPAVPAGGGHDPARDARRDSGRRALGPARHGAAHPDHGDAPRPGAVGPRRGVVQPGPVRGGGLPRGEPPAGVRAVRAGPADVHRAEPGPPGGEAHAGRAPPPVRAPALAQLRARAHRAHAALPAVRRAGDLPAPPLR